MLAVGNPNSDPRKQQIIEKLLTMACVAEKDVTIIDYTDGTWKALVDATDIECTIFPQADGNLNLSVKRFGL